MSTHLIASGVIPVQIDTSKEDPALINDVGPKFSTQKEYWDGLEKRQNEVLGAAPFGAKQEAVTLLSLETLAVQVYNLKSLSEADLEDIQSKLDFIRNKIVAVTKQ